MQHCALSACRLTGAAGQYRLGPAFRRRMVLFAIRPILPQYERIRHTALREAQTTPIPLLPKEVLIPELTPPPPLFWYLLLARSRPRTWDCTQLPPSSQSRGRAGAIGLLWWLRPNLDGGEDYSQAVGDNLFLFASQRSGPPLCCNFALLQACSNLLPFAHVQ